MPPLVRTASCPLPTPAAEEPRRPGSPEKREVGWVRLLRTERMTEEKRKRKKKENTERKKTREKKKEEKKKQEKKGRKKGRKQYVYMYTCVC